MKSKQKEIISQENKKEIFYNLINSALAGGLVLVGSLASGNISPSGIAASFVAAAVVFLTKFKNYWDGEKGEYASKIFTFI